MVVGLVLIPRLSIQYKADYVSNDLTVNYYYPASARAVEAEVTTLIEGAVNTIPGVENISSISAWGCGSVTASFKKGTDMAESRFNLNTRLRQIRSGLPADAVIELAGKASGREIKNILTYTINTDVPFEKARSFIEENLVSVIGVLDGIDRVDLSDGQEMQWEVSYNAGLLERAGLSIDNLFSAIQNSSCNRLIGSFKTDTGTMTMRLVSKTDAASLSELPVGMANGRLYHLGDFARIQKVRAEPYSYHRINGLECIQVNVYAADGINTMKTCEQVRAKADVAFASFPAGYAIEQTYDASESLGQQIRNVVSRAVISLLLLLAFVMLVSRSFKYLAIIGFSVLSDLLLSVVIFSVSNVGIDMFSMAGITVSFGMVMDTAIVMTDHYSYYGNRKAASPIAAALFTTVSALLLVFYLPDELRHDLNSFVWVTVIILTVSFATALFLVPALAEKTGLQGKSLVTGNVANRRRNVLFSQWYYNCISSFRKHRIAIVIAMTVLLGGTCSLFVFFNRQFDDYGIDEYRSRTLDMVAMMPTGYGLAHADRIARIMDNFLSGFDQINRFETDVNDRNVSFSISFKDEFRDEITVSEIRDAIWKKALTIGGASWSVMPYGHNDRLLTNYVGRREWPDRISLYGYDYDLLCHYATLVMNDLLQHPRVKDAAVISSLMSDGTDEEFILEYDRERLARMNLNPYFHFAVLAENLLDFTAGSFGTGNETLPVVLKSDNRDEFDLWFAQNATIGPGIKLSEIGSMTKSKVGGIIERENQEYVVEVGYEFIGSDLSKFSMCYDEEEKLAEVLPLGFRTDSYSGHYTPEQKRKLWTLLIVVACVIFGICAAMFESLRMSLAIILLIPSGLSGIFLLFPFLGLRMGQGCLASMVMMSGLVVNAAIYISAEYRDLSRTCRQSPLRIYVKAFNRKIIPTILTIASTVIGLVPFLFDGLDSAFWFTFAAGVMVGLLFSMAGLLFCFPLFLPLPKEKEAARMSCFFR